jgi:hypothetical protein
MNTALTLKPIALEEAGLMVKPASRTSAKHTLLRPVNIRLADTRSAHPWLSENYEWWKHHDEESLADPEAYLYWEALEKEEVDPSVTWDAVWEVVRLTDATPKEILSFVQRWGSLAGQWDVEGYGDRHGDGQAAVHVGDWREFADFVERLLTLLAATAQQEVVDEAFLGSIQQWDELPEVPEAKPPPEPSQEDIEAWMRSLNAKDVLEAFDERMRRQLNLRWENLLAERHRGMGVQQQRRMLSRTLSDLLGTQYVSFIWDERGRAMRSQAYGLDEIIFSHIATIFLAPEVDILVCSVCALPYPFDESTQGRRPRYGVRRFCSDDCRSEGKRESNRLSWRRNSSRWRRRGSGSSSREGGGQDGPS